MFVTSNWFSRTRVHADPSNTEGPKAEMDNVGVGNRRVKDCQVSTALNGNEFRSGLGRLIRPIRPICCKPMNALINWAGCIVYN